MNHGFSQVSEREGEVVALGDKSASLRQHGWTLPKTRMSFLAFSQHCHQESISSLTLSSDLNISILLPNWHTECLLFCKRQQPLGFERTSLPCILITLASVTLDTVTRHVPCLLSHPLDVTAKLFCVLLLKIARSGSKPASSWRASRAGGSGAAEGELAGPSLTPPTRARDAAISLGSAAFRACPWPAVYQTHAGSSKPPVLTGTPVRGLASALYDLHQSLPQNAATGRDIRIWDFSA